MSKVKLSGMVVVLAERITTVIGMFLEQKIAMNILCSPLPSYGLHNISYNTIQSTEQPTNMDS